MTITKPDDSPVSLELNVEKLKRARISKIVALATGIESQPDVRGPMRLLRF